MYFHDPSLPAEEEGKAFEDMPEYKEFDSTYHPGLTEKDLDHRIYCLWVKDYGEKKYADGEGHSELLCRNCGYSSQHEIYSGYTSRIKIVYARRNSAIWALGSDWMLRDEPNDITLGNDYDALEFLRVNKTTIPVPQMRRISSPTDKIHLTLMSRMHGERLYDVWRSYTTEQKISVAKELGGYIRQWRQFTAPRCQKVNGNQLDDFLIGNCGMERAPGCKKIGYTMEEWFEELLPELREGLSNRHKTEDPQKLDQLLKELKDKFPKGGPYIFTHGDLNFSNIIVSQGKITGIIDWEKAGFCPWWAERWKAGQVSVYLDEIYELIGDDLCSGYDTETYIQETEGVMAVCEVWEDCDRTHISPNAWFRQPFCECKPYRGYINEEAMGVPDRHKILYLKK